MYAQFLPPKYIESNLLTVVKLGHRENPPWGTGSPCGQQQLMKVIFFSTDW